MSETIDELIDRLVAATEEYQYAREVYAALDKKFEYETTRAALRAAISEKDAEIERLKDVIRKVEWYIQSSEEEVEDGIFYIYCPICSRISDDGHHKDCPFFGWEGGE